MDTTSDRARPFAAAWFTREGYWKLLAVADDRRCLPQSYEAWVTYAEAQFNQLMAQGHRPIKINVEVADLAEFCRATNRPIDAEARAEFAAGTLLDLSELDGRGPRSRVRAAGGGPGRLLGFARERSYSI